MENLERNAKKDVRGMVLTMLCFAIGAVSIPFSKIAGWMSDDMAVEFWCGFICKTLCSLVAFYVIVHIGMKKMLSSFSNLKRCLLIIPALAVAITNFPIIPQIMGYMSINVQIYQLIPYILYCLSIGLLEESLFRGNILPLLMYAFPRNKKGLFWAIIASSAIFGGMHLLNLLGGFYPGVFLQVGYSFLIGCACAVSMLLTENLFSAVLVHGLFDIGGLMFESFGSGTLWTSENIIFTAVVGVVCGVIILIAFLKIDFSDVYERWGLNNRPQEDKTQT